VICGAGFELAGESLQLGKKLLVKPLKGQFEQLSNALALEKASTGKDHAAPGPQSRSNVTGAETALSFSSR
jgi:uncharacterized protein (TIGR00661 family)